MAFELTRRRAQTHQEYTATTKIALSFVLALENLKFKSKVDKFWMMADSIKTKRKNSELFYGKFCARRIIVFGIVFVGKFLIAQRIKTEPTEKMNRYHYYHWQYHYPSFQSNLLIVPWKSLIGSDRKKRIGFIVSSLLCINFIRNNVFLFQGHLLRYSMTTTKNGAKVKENE